MGGWSRTSEPVTVSELKDALRQILVLEACSVIEWDRVQKISDEAVRRLNTEPEPTYLYYPVYQFLEDHDVRKKSEIYAQGQREKVSAYLDE